MEQVRRVPERSGRPENRVAVTPPWLSLEPVANVYRVGHGSGFECRTGTAMDTETVYPGRATFFTM